MDQQRAVSNAFRVYSCTNCPNIAFQQVEARSDESRCSACGAAIRDDPKHAYVDTPTRAGWVISWRVFHRHEGDSVWQGRGLRSALTVFRVVEKEWKRAGKAPIPTDRVLSRCRTSGILLSEARGSLEWLQKDGRIRMEGDGIVDVLDSEIERG